MSDDIAFLIDAGEADRQRWFAERPDLNANSCLHLMITIKCMIRDGVADRSSLVLLYLWLVRRGRDVGWFTSRDACISVSSFAAELYATGAGDDVTGVLPSADQIVADCLDQIPLSVAEVPDAIDLNRMDVDQMRCSRAAKNLIVAAGWHAARIFAPEIAERLRIWTELLPRLV